MRRRNRTDSGMGVQRLWEIRRQQRMSKHVLITGGAGFIGSHLADELLNYGYRIRALDVLAAQVHGPQRQRPDYLNPEVELIMGDIRDSAVVRRALQGIDAVYHFAAAVGVGQSMYKIEHYTSTNNLGTAVLLQALIERPVERLIVASSMSVYGEGLYRAPDGTVSAGEPRSPAQLKAGAWEVRNARGEPLMPMPTPETKTLCPASVYALSKYDQEQLCLTVGRAYGFPAVGLRFFNVFGPRQALSNPYTGVLAIFTSCFLNGSPPLVFEDGYQCRDFVSVDDVVQACRLALEVPEAAGCVFNVGSGRHDTVRMIAEHIAVVLGKEHIRPRITGRYRVGDVRHCFADITSARQVLGYEPQVTLDKGLVQFAAWVEKQMSFDRCAQAYAELDARGLTI
jgi:dTDP-L-rhamnose 4-epimerase